MKLDVISHCTIDTIEINDSKFVVPGGPGCYCSLTARSLKFDVKLHTKFGSDFPLVNYLVEQKIAFEDAQSTKPTTQFILNLANSERTLFLQNKCEPINNITLDSDSVIISPLFDEISIELFEKIKKSANFVFLDPQGFLRRKNSEEKVTNIYKIITLSISASKQYKKTLTFNTFNTHLRKARCLTFIY